MARVSFNSSSKAASRPASRVSYRGGQPSKPAAPSKPNSLQAKFEASRKSREANQRMQAQFDATRGRGVDQRLTQGQQADAARYSQQRPVSDRDFAMGVRTPNAMDIPGFTPQPVQPQLSRANQAYAQRMQGYADYQVQQAANRQRGWDATRDRYSGLGAWEYSKPLAPQWTTADYTAPYAYAYGGQASADSNPYTYTPPAPDYGGGGGYDWGGGGGGGGGGGYQQMPEWWMAMTNWRI